MAERLKTAERREEVADLRLRGLTVREIAARCGVSHTTVIRDIREVEQVWIARAADVLGLAKGREVSRLELVIREAWDAWERSKQPEKKIVERKARRRNQSSAVRDQAGADDLVVTSRITTVSQRAGASRFLSVIVTASAQIAQILGLNSAAELNITVQRYITSAAAELGVTPSELQEEINGIMETAWAQSWSPAVPS